MSDAEITSVAALISVILRRKATRIIDVKWLVKNQEYAREIIQLSREQGQADLTEYANHLEQLMFGSISNIANSKAVSPGINGNTLAKPTSPVSGSQASATTSAISSMDDQEDADGKLDNSQYVGHLR